MRTLSEMVDRHTNPHKYRKQETAAFHAMRTSEAMKIHRSYIADWKNTMLSTLALTKKERLVAECILRGLSTKVICAELGNTEKTMKHHITSIFQKAGVASRAELFARICGLE